MTTSIADAGSNMVLSGSGSVGFTIVDSTTKELVTFSLTDGSIIKRTTVPSLPDTLAMYEAAGKRLLAFRSSDQLKVFDALDPAQPQESVSVSLVGNNEFSALPNDDIVFSSNGRFVFFASQFFNFAAIDLNTKSIVGTIAGNFRFWRVAIYDDGQHRLLAALSLPAGTGGTSALLLVDATNPAQLTIVNSITSGDRELFNRRREAQNGMDYNPVSGALTFEPGQVLSSLGVPIIDDATDEFDEQFNVNISPNVGILQQGQSTVTILDDDAPPQLAIADTNTIEGTIVGRTLAFQVGLSVPSGKPVTVIYTTAAGTADSSDFIATNGMLTIPAGQTLATIQIGIRQDGLSENNETVFLNLSSPVNATIVDNQAIGTILDDDAIFLAVNRDTQRAIALDAVWFVQEPFSVNNQNYPGADQRTRVALFTTNLILTDGLPDGITSPRDLQVSVTARGRISNKVLVAVKP